MDPHLQRALADIDAATQRSFCRRPGGAALAGQVGTVRRKIEHLGKAYGGTAYILDKCVRRRRTQGPSSHPGGSDCPRR